MELRDKVAVVIGGAGGIGRGVCAALAAEGAVVVVADLDVAGAQQVVDSLRTGGAEASALRVDATDVDSLRGLADEVVARHGAVHVLVNLAGVITNRRLEEATEDEWAWFWEFNVMAHVRANNVFLPHLRAAGAPAHIVNTSSMAGMLVLGPELVGGFANGLYTTTKHALVGYCGMLRSELEPEGIGVSVLCPGLVEGTLSASSARNRPERFGGPTPDPRGGAPKSRHAMDSDTAGFMVVEGIKANRHHIFTHPEGLPMVEARNDVVAADFAAAAEAAARRGR